MIQKTYMAKTNAVKNQSYLIDAQDKILGRVAAKAAALLLGKNSKTYTPHVFSGNQVIIINAAKIKVSGKKLTDKEYNKYTGYHSGLKFMSLGKMLQNNPVQVMKLAITRMIPKGPLGNKIKTKLKIYAGDKHPHTAQKPILYSI
ncbi:MAG TPA: 50S ribosomal protein L13 [Candidatus Omnitrophota bacterium]|nr:50S ribosomal protein L13 [Candidatus Omnitrophota bacterium]HPN88549.1 50S ribosomal protein L13 [Candidatus Omnitrophota bacterium]